MWTYVGNACASFAAGAGFSDLCGVAVVTGTDDAGATVTAYEACEASCAQDDALDASIAVRSCTTGAPAPSPPSPAAACADDAAWTNGGNNCAAFVAASGAAGCIDSSNTGTNTAGATVTAYEACEASCAQDDGADAAIATRSCTAGTPAPAPTRTCADTDADGTPDEFDCDGSGDLGTIFAITATASEVACEGDTCTAAECCTLSRTCADIERPRVNAEGASDSAAQIVWDCSASNDAIDASPADISCDPDGTGTLCSHSTCCTVLGTVRSCADQDMDGVADANPFDCSAEINDLSSSPSTVACQGDACTAAECCTVAPPRTCADKNADGTTDEIPFDCSGAVNEITNEPDSITCDGPATCTETASTSVMADAANCAAVTGTELDTSAACEGVMMTADDSAAACTYASASCTEQLCCTTVPDRTCADSTLLGSSTDGVTVVYDCSEVQDAEAETGFITTDPGAEVCAGDVCTPDECCTGSSPPPRTCGDTDANSSPDAFDFCADSANTIVDNPAGVSCQGDTCLVTECCTSPPPLTCADTSFVGTSAPNVPYNCSSSVKLLAESPATVECAGPLECTQTECCTVEPTLPPTPTGKATVASSITLEATMEEINEDLATFKETFKRGVAFQFSTRELSTATTPEDCVMNGGNWLDSSCKLSVTAADVTITDIKAGSVVVEYGIQLLVAQVSAVVYGTMVGGSIGGFPVAQWGPLLVTDDSCPGTCGGVVYPDTAPGCSCTAQNKLLCPLACSRPRRKVCIDAGTTVLYTQTCPPPPPPPPSDDYSALMPWGWIILVMICFCTAFGKIKQARQSGKVEPEDHEDESKFVHMMLARKAGTMWDGASAAAGGVVPTQVHSAVSAAGGVASKGVKAAADVSFRAADATLAVGGAVAGGVGTVAKGAGNLAAPVALATLDAGVAVAKGAGNVAVATGGAVATGAKMAGSAALVGISVAAKGTRSFADKLKRKTKESKERAVAEPEPEPEPAAVEDSLSFGDGSAFGSDENLGFVDGPHDDEAPPPADDAPDRGAGRLRGTPGA